MGIRLTKDKGIWDQLRSRFKEEDIWYPSEKDVIRIHKETLEKYGGYLGFERGIIVYRYIIDEAKSVEGIYRKAAIIMRGIGTKRIFKDGNHRTALVVTDTFLRANGEKIAVKNTDDRFNFIRRILFYNMDQVEEWLKYGKALKERD